VLGVCITSLLARLYAPGGDVLDQEPQLLYSLLDLRLWSFREQRDLARVITRRLMSLRM
jgi:hypothetical protein